MLVEAKAMVTATEAGLEIAEHGLGPLEQWWFRRLVCSQADKSSARIQAGQWVSHDQFLRQHRSDGKRNSALENRSRLI